MNKALLRQEMKKRAENIVVADKESADKAIFETLFSLPEYEKAKKLFVYVSDGAEVSTRPIIEKSLGLGKEVFVPLCHGKGIMDAIRINAFSELSVGRYGLLEPRGDGERANPEELDLIIAPGVAFDKECHRLGRGAGYYDRYIQKAKKAYCIGICYGAFLEEKIEAEAHDERMDAVISEKGERLWTKET